MLILMLICLLADKFKRTGTKRLQMTPKATGEGLLNGTLSRHDPSVIILFLFITVPQPKETCARRGEALKHLLWPSFHQVCVTALHYYSRWAVASHLVLINLLPPSRKKCKYVLRASKSSSRLIKFLVNTIYIYGSKIIYFKNTFRN
jgi:hypothetical protein